MQVNKTDHRNKDDDAGIYDYKTIDVPAKPKREVGKSNNQSLWFHVVFTVVLISALTAVVLGFMASEKASTFWALILVSLELGTLTHSPSHIIRGLVGVIGNTALAVAILYSQDANVLYAMLGVAWLMSEMKIKESAE